MLRALFAVLICSNCGCGTFTCLNMAAENPRTQVIYGGVRTDANCVVGNRVTEKETPELYFGTFGQCVLKTCSIIDLPLSLAADTLTLPYAIWLTFKKKPVPPAPEQDVRPVDETQGNDGTLPSTAPTRS